MTTTRDEMWADLLQFDTRLADRVWDGDLHDPEAPRWYGEVGALIRQARGPGEPHELVDEPVVVTSMRRIRLGRAVPDPPRRNRVRVLGRVVAVKVAAVATTAGMAGVAAAATTGIVAAAVVGPAINDHIGPFIGGAFPSTVEVTDSLGVTDSDPGATYRVPAESVPNAPEPGGPVAGEAAKVATPVLGTTPVAPVPLIVPPVVPVTGTDGVTPDRAQLSPTEGEVTEPAGDTGEVPADPVPEPTGEPASPMVDTTGEPPPEDPADGTATPTEPAPTDPADGTATPTEPAPTDPADGTATPTTPADDPAEPTDDTAEPAPADDGDRRSGAGVDVPGAGTPRSENATASPRPTACQHRPGAVAAVTNGHAPCSLDVIQVTNPG